jgi:hypothetical protein
MFCLMQLWQPAFTFVFTFMTRLRWFEFELLFGFAIFNFRSFDANREEIP